MLVLMLAVMKGVMLMLMTGSADAGGVLATVKSGRPQSFSKLGLRPPPIEMHL